MNLAIFEDFLVLSLNFASKTLANYDVDKLISPVSSSVARDTYSSKYFAIWAYGTFFIISFILMSLNPFWTFSIGTLIILGVTGFSSSSKASSL